MRQQRVKHSKIGVAESGGGRWKVEKVTNHDIDKDAEVVGVEVFVGGRGGEEQVEEFEDQELEGCLACRTSDSAVAAFARDELVNVLSRLSRRMMFSPKVLKAEPWMVSVLMTLLVRLAGGG